MLVCVTESHSGDVSGSWFLEDWGFWFTLVDSVEGDLSPLYHGVLRSPLHRKMICGGLLPCFPVTRKAPLYRLIVDDESGTDRIPMHPPCVDRHCEELCTDGSLNLKLHHQYVCAPTAKWLE